MTDLSAKFDALQQQITNQHNFLTTQIAGLATKLDQVENAVTALGGGASLLDIVNKPFELTGGATVNFDTTPIVDAITALRGTGPENTIKSLNQSVWNLAGTAPGRSLLDLYDLLDSALMAQATAPDPQVPYLLQLRSIAGVYGDGDPQTGNIRSLLDLVHQELDSGAGITLYNRIDGIFTNIAALIDNIGIPTGDATTTVLGRLLIILNLLNNYLPDLVACCESAGGKQAPSATDDGMVCIEPVVSSGMAISALIPGTIRATWSNVPSGIIITDTLGVEPNTEIQIADTTGWRVWVASNAAQYAQRPLDPERFPTNQWRTMGEGPATFSFSVDSQYSITVYLCDSINWIEDDGGDNGGNDGGSNNDTLGPFSSTTGNLPMTIDAFAGEIQYIEYWGSYGGHGDPRINIRQLDGSAIQSNIPPPQAPATQYSQNFTATDSQIVIQHDYGGYADAVVNILVHRGPKPV